MCGVVGAVSIGPVDPRLIEKMRDRLVHRGPDDAGLWCGEDGRVALGHRRLSVIDPTPEAKGPFASQDGRIVISYNGEIYNWRSMRRELERAGATFRTQCDTEVIVEAYDRWGDDCLQRLDGMFAFALWDAGRKRLLCARDRVGEKPFHYSVIDGSFAFASELKSLLLWPGFRREPDYTALVDFLTFGFVVDPKSIWLDARKLPAGHFLVVDLRADGTVAVGEPQAYWDFEPSPDEGETDWEGRIRATLQSVAADMSYADVPVGAFLSGGVDSSAVTAALAHSGHQVGTYTIGFADADFDERGWARTVSQTYATPHAERLVVADDVEAVFRSAVSWYYDEPFNDYSYVPTYYVCREARRDITVALSGDGGDELFGGYGKYRRLALRAGLERGVSRPVSQLAAAVGSAVLPGARLRAYGSAPHELLASMLTTNFSAARLRQIARGPLADALSDYSPTDAIAPLLAKAPPAELGLVNSMRYLDLKLTLGAGILTKVDRASMAVSLEVRPVFLHPEMLGLAAAVPPRLLADRRETKKVLKRALRPWLPDAVLYRQKMGFAMPLGRWLRDGSPLLETALRPDSLASTFLDTATMRQTAAVHASGREDRTAALHSLVFLDHWLAAWS